MSNYEECRDRPLQDTEYCSTVDSLRKALVISEARQKHTKRCLKLSRNSASSNWKYGKLRTVFVIPVLSAELLVSEVNIMAVVPTKKSSPRKHDSLLRKPSNHTFLFEEYLVLGKNGQPACIRDVLGSVYEVYPNLEEAHLVAKALKRKLQKVTISYEI